MQKSSEQTFGLPCTFFYGNGIVKEIIARVQDVSGGIKEKDCILERQLPESDFDKAITQK